MGIIRAVNSQKVILPGFGYTHIRVLSTAVNVTARWKGDVLHLTIPPYTTVARLNEVLDSMRARIMAMKPSFVPLYYVGYRFATDGLEFSIGTSDQQPLHRVRIDMSRTDVRARRFLIAVHPDADLAAENMQDAVARIVKRIAKTLSDDLIIQAARTAADLGIPTRRGQFSIGHGMRRRGCCNARGDISLSYTLMLMPLELRRATITHELAHLQHFDHSPAFYALWDKYLGYSHTRLKAMHQANPLPLPTYERE